MLWAVYFRVIDTWSMNLASAQAPRAQIFWCHCDTDFDRSKTRTQSCVVSHFIIPSQPLIVIFGLFGQCGGLRKSSLPTKSLNRLSSTQAMALAIVSEPPSPEIKRVEDARKRASRGWRIVRASVLIARHVRIIESVRDLVTRVTPVGSCAIFISGRTTSKMVCLVVTI